MKTKRLAVKTKEDGLKIIIDMRRKRGHDFSDKIKLTYERAFLGEIFDTSKKTVINRKMISDSWWLEFPEEVEIDIK